MATVELLEDEVLKTLKTLFLVIRERDAIAEYPSEIISTPNKNVQSCTKKRLTTSQTKSQKEAIILLKFKAAGEL